MTDQRPTSYTIDLDGRDGRWRWMLYTRGGTVRVADGSAETLEQASADARTAMFVDHRQVEEMQT